MDVGRIDPRALAALVSLPQVEDRQRQVGEAIHDEATRLAPVKSGTLSRGVDTEEVRDDREALEVRVGWNLSAYYGALVELGTEDTPAQPHLRPAAIKIGGGSRVVPD